MGSVVVRSGNNERDLGSVDGSWIHHQVNRRRANGAAVCVQVRIECNDLHISLSTPKCELSGGRSRALTRPDASVIDDWQACRLNTAEFDATDVEAFLKKLARAIR